MIREYIANSSSRMKRNAGSFSVLGGKVQVQIKDPLPVGIDFIDIFTKIRKMLPDNFFLGLESIIIGYSEEFENKQVNAFYENGTLHITNDQDSDADLIDDIVHEIAHMIEERYSEEIYGDGYIRAEFLGKRNKLLDILTAHGYNIPTDEFMELEYSVDFDNLLYKEIGYEKLTNFTTGLFIGPYSVTSIREYFAVGFEEYFTKYGERPYIQLLCPVLYKKIKFLEEKLGNA
tara:strand:+ start:1229 stop:1924 length:696 start_codon:yes stop_codon:yes gene_type:complete